MKPFVLVSGFLVLLGISFAQEGSVAEVSLTDNEVHDPVLHKLEPFQETNGGAIGSGWFQNTIGDAVKHANHAVGRAKGAAARARSSVDDAARKLAKRALSKGSKSKSKSKSGKQKNTDCSVLTCEAPLSFLVDLIETPFQALNLDLLLTLWNSLLDDFWGTLSTIWEMLSAFWSDLWSGGSRLTITNPCAFEVKKGPLFPKSEIMYKADEAKDKFIVMGQLCLF